MAEVREMTIPLRAAWSVPRTRRANRAMAQIKKHVSQHMKKTKKKYGSMNLLITLYGLVACKTRQEKFVFKLLERKVFL